MGEKRQWRHYANEKMGKQNASILGRFSIIYFCGLGLRIMVRVWVRVRVRVWVRVRVGVRVSVVIWSL